MTLFCSSTYREVASAAANGCTWAKLELARRDEALRDEYEMIEKGRPHSPTREAALQLYRAMMEDNRRVRASFGLSLPDTASSGSLQAHAS